MNQDIHQLLKKYWGFDAFRPLQEDIIQQSLKGKDVLALLPTGGGKSICFQVPILAKSGVGIVISPLIALMEDQVQNLKNRGIKAIALTSGLSHTELDIALENAVNGYYKFLYVSPERIQNELVQERLKRMNINLIAVDEAHCISQWGYDFRPAYLQIAELRKLLPKVTVLALTATATPKVVEDIQSKLEFKTSNVFQKSFYRENLVYSVLHTEQKWSKCLAALNKSKGTAIIYARNRKGTAEIAKWLQQNGLSADFYHAGLSADVRSKKLQKWLNNETRIMACTNAFGMGIDKSDVRLVMHLELPDSLEAYFQEAGRAGRDGEEAHALMLLAPNDIDKLTTRYLDTFPTQENVKHVYQCLANHLQLAVGGSSGREFPFSTAEFSKKYSLNPFMALQALKMLEKEELIALSEASFQSSRIFLKVDRTQLYDFQLRNPKLDDFIKMLMRSYGGLSVEFTPIDEEVLALRMKTNPETVKQTLLHLQKVNLISYKPKQDKAIITILKNRLEPKSLRISDKFLKDRKIELEARIKAVVHYAQQNSVCRSSVLLHYFGEKNSEPCGRCDVCRANKKMRWSTVQKLELENQIITICKTSGGISLQQLIYKLAQPETFVNHIVHYLLEKNIIRIETNKIFLN